MPLASRLLLAASLLQAVWSIARFAEDERNDPCINEETGEVEYFNPFTGCTGYKSFRRCHVQDHGEKPEYQYCADVKEEIDKRKALEKCVEKYEPNLGKAADEKRFRGQEKDKAMEAIRQALKNKEADVADVVDQQCELAAASECKDMRFFKGFDESNLIEKDKLLEQAQRCLEYISFAAPTSKYHQKQVGFYTNPEQAMIFNPQAALPTAILTAAEKAGRTGLIEGLKKACPACAGANNPEQGAKGEVGPNPNNPEQGANKEVGADLGPNNPVKGAKGEVVNPDVPKHRSFFTKLKKCLRKLWARR